MFPHNVREVNWIISNTGLGQTEMFYLNNKLSIKMVNQSACNEKNQVWKKLGDQNFISNINGSLPQAHRPPPPLQFSQQSLKLNLCLHQNKKFFFIKTCFDVSFYWERFKWENICCGMSFYTLWIYVALIGW